MDARPLTRLALLAATLLGSGAIRAAELPSMPDVPRAEAVRSPDGSFVITLYPPLDWIAAEVEVKGGDGVDLGAAKLNQPVRVRGVSSRKGPLLITLRVATPQRIGVTWEFEVEPTAVPSQTPELKRGEPARKRRGRH